jgi:Domain of unknown function (DUF4430)
MFRPLFVLILLCLSTVAIAADQEVVSLTIRFDKGFEKHYTAIPWKKEMTIADALDAAAQHSRGIRYKKRGTGATTILLEIDDLANGTDGKYWIFDQNGKEGELSYAVVKLAAGDSVVWRFDSYP